jgi:hypothetical protein
MRQVVLAVLASATLAVTFSTAQADSYYGPRKVGNLCWKHQLGNSLGYWMQCPTDNGRSAQASGRRTSR